MSDTTVWKYIEGFEDKRYVISNDGRVYDRKLSKKMILSKDGRFELSDPKYITKSSTGRFRKVSRNTLMKKYFPETITNNKTN